MRSGALIFAVALILVMAILPPLIGGYAVQALTSYLISGLLALSVGLITGYGRLFNLGVGANFGVSAYTVAILTHSGITEPFTLMIAAIAAGVVVSLLFAFYALIASGVEYLMLTFLTALAFASIPHAMNELTGGDNGLTVTGGLKVSWGMSPLNGNNFYWFVLAVVVVCTGASWYVLASQTGKAIQAIGRNPSRAAAMGYSVARYRVALTVFSSLIASVGGWLFALQRSFVFIDLLGLNNSTNGLVYALVGGVDTILGPLLGASVLRLLTDQLSRGSTQSSLYIGIVLMLVVYFLPDGLVGLWRRVRGRRVAAHKPQPRGELA